MSENIRSATVEERVINTIAMFCGVSNEQVDRQQKLVEIDPNFDSLEAVELVMEIEDAFNIEIDDDTAASFNRVQDYIDHIASRKDIQ